MKKLIFIALLLISSNVFAQIQPQKAPDGIETKFIQLDTLTTALRDALTPKLGQLIYHKDTGISQSEQYNGTAWVVLGSGEIDGLTSEISRITIDDRDLEIDQNVTVKGGGLNIGESGTPGAIITFPNNDGSIEGLDNVPYGISWDSDESAARRDEVYTKIESLPIGISEGILTASRDLIPTDPDLLSYSGSTDITITVDTDANAGFTENKIYVFYALGAGNIIVDFSAVTVNGISGSTAQTYTGDKSITIKRTGTDTWDVINAPTDVNTTINTTINTIQSILSFPSLSDFRANTIEGTIGKMAETQNYFSTMEGGGARFKLISLTSTGYTDNAGNIIIDNTGRVWKAEIDGTYIDVAIFGVLTGNNSSDNATKFNAASTYVFNDSYYDGIILTEFINVDSTIYLHDNHYNATGRVNYIGSSLTADVLVFGDNSYSLRRMDYKGLSASRNAATVIGELPTAGAAIKIMNLNESYVEIENAANCYKAVDLFSDRGFGYNTFYLGLMENAQIMLDLNPVDTGTNGWTNENLFLGGRFRHGDESLYEDPTLIKIGNYGAINPANNNVFIKPSVEGGSRDMILINFAKAHLNEFRNIRNEIHGGATKVLFGDSSYPSSNNKIQTFFPINFAVEHAKVFSDNQITWIGDNEQNIYPVLELDRDDFFFYQTRDANTSFNNIKNARVQSISTSTFSDASSNLVSKINKKTIDIVETTGIGNTFGDYFEVDTLSVLKVNVKGEGLDLIYKAFDASFNLVSTTTTIPPYIVNDGISTVYTDILRSFEHEDNKNVELKYFQDNVKYIWVGVAFHDATGKFEKLTVSSNNATKYYEDRRKSKLSNGVPDLGYFFEGEKYKIQSQNKFWICTSSGDFSDVGNEPTFEEIEITSSNIDSSITASLALADSALQPTDNIDADTFGGNALSLFPRLSTSNTFTGSFNKIADNSNFYIGDGGDVRIVHDGTNNLFRLYNGDWVFQNVTTETVRIAKTGDITSLHDIKADTFSLDGLNTAPASATATGTTGEIRVVADYIYVCIATDTWVRTALTSWTVTPP